jgi:penicillin-binding protein 1A
MLSRFVFIILLSITLMISAALGVIFYVSEHPWVDFSILEHYNPGKPSILLDDEGNEWGRFELDKRQVRKLSQIPPCVIHAFIAAEDWQFFSHGGLSYKGIIRSTLVNLGSLRKAQGASTITQQLVRLLFFETKKSYLRKIKEQLLALVVEKQFTKEQILETYLNHIYLGAGIYGVEAACQRFWGKPVTACTIDEAAVLASIVRYPRKYCPLYHPESTIQRRNLILKNMASLGYISHKEYEEARLKPVACIPAQRGILASHLKESLRLALEEMFGKKQLYTGGLIIQTTLNSSMQRHAERVFQAHFKTLHSQYSKELEGALICIEGSTGAIKALVGGCNFSASQFNRAFNARRQMGSTFKPLVFAQALQTGRSFRDIEIDEPFSLSLGSQEWAPSNASQKFKGPMTLASALSSSNNIIAIKVFLRAGPEEIVRLARSCELNPTHAYPSLALGAIEASPLETAATMNIFAQKGRYAKPYSMVWVKDEWGTKHYKMAPIKRQILAPVFNDQIAQVLTHRIERARKQTPDLFPRCDALGKSGTTNDARTCWFVGATPRYTTAIYVGFDDNRSLGKYAFGSRTAFPLWRAFNHAINQPVESFAFDTHLDKVCINEITGQHCSPDDPQACTILITQPT